MQTRLREKTGDAIDFSKSVAPIPISKKSYNTISFCHRPTQTDQDRQRLSKSRDPGAASFPASLTVEAALTLPLFLLLCSLFFTFFSGQIWQLRLQKALDDVCEDVAVWSYLIDFADDYTSIDLLALADGGLISGALDGDGDSVAALLAGEADLISEIRVFLAAKGSALLWQPLLKSWVAARAGTEALRASPVIDGAQGLSLSGSSLHGRNLDLVLSYEIGSAVRFPFQLRYPVVQRSCRRLWIGTKVEKPDSQEDTEEEEEKQEDIVYVTANGAVYHLTKSCRVLALKILTVDASVLPTLRNTSGGKYYPCDRCAKNQTLSGTTVIITEPGTRYHYRFDCPSLKRTIRELPVSEAKEKYRPCHYCGGDDP